MQAVCCNQILTQQFIEGAAISIYACANYKLWILDVWMYVARRYGMA